MRRLLVPWVQYHYSIHWHIGHELWQIQQLGMMRGTTNQKRCECTGLQSVSVWDWSRIVQRVIPAFFLTLKTFLLHPPSPHGYSLPLFCTNHACALLLHQYCPLVPPSYHAHLPHHSVAPAIFAIALLLLCAPTSRAYASHIHSWKQQCQDQGSRPVGGRGPCDNTAILSVLPVFLLTPLLSSQYSPAA